MIDCSLIAVPPLVLNGPPIALGLLKAVAAEHGYNVWTYNPSPDIYEKLKQDEKKSWPYTKLNINFQLKYPVDDWVEEIVDKALDKNPRFIGLSIHTWSGEFFAIEIASRIREVNPSIKIVVGGAAAMELYDTIRPYVDYIVVGDGEHAFLNCLEGRFDFPTMNTKKYTPISQEEYDNLPYPDYSDMDIEWFKQRTPKENRIYLVGSRGCVFDCAFCNVPTMMKYRFKDGEKFAHEVKHMQEKYNPTNIEFGDSLVNGSLKQYRKLIATLAKLNEEKPETKPRLVSFYRIRPMNQTREEDFELAAKAGFYRFKIGVESGSDQVRKDIGKTETNEEIIYTLRMMKKYGINANLLIIVGYPTETRKDFQDTLDMLKMIHEEGLDSVVDRAVVNELYISQGTRLADQVEELEIQNAFGSASEKMDRPWIRVLPNGEVLDETVREARLKEVLDYIENNFVNANSLLVFSGKEDSDRRREGDKT